MIQEGKSKRIRAIAFLRFNIVFEESHFTTVEVGGNLGCLETRLAVLRAIIDPISCGKAPLSPQSITTAMTFTASVRTCQISA